MISIQLPDGSRREYPGPVTVAEVASSIGPGLAKAALAGRIGQGGRSVSSTRASPSTTTSRSPSSPRKTPTGSTSSAIRRRTCSPTGEGAVSEAQVTIGPVIENGFYYDFAYERPFTPDDLAEAIGSEDDAQDRERRTIKVERLDDAARRGGDVHFSNMGEKYKAEIIGSASRPTKHISLYRAGAISIDLCRGPHVPSHRQAARTSNS